MIAGAPAILGAVIGASVYNQELATLPDRRRRRRDHPGDRAATSSIRDASGSALNPLSIAGIVAGVALMYATGLLIAL